MGPWQNLDTQSREVAFNVSSGGFEDIKKRTITERQKSISIGDLLRWFHCTVQICQNPLVKPFTDVIPYSEPFSWDFWKLPKIAKYLG
jgi:hypothetical protein